jgi:hypothetical protein
MPCSSSTRPTRGRLLLAPLLLLLALVAGCASTVTTQVTPFHELVGGLQGQRFVIVPTPEQQSSLEFGAYADLVRQALVGKGMVDAGDDRARADLAVSIAYEVFGRTGGFYNGGAGYAGYAGFGAGSGGLSMGGIGIGIGFPIGGGSSSEANYQRTLHVRIDRLRGGAAPETAPAPAPSAVPGAAPLPEGALPGQPAPTTRVFEARAISEGPSASIAPVMRAMVQAIFEEFPGESGKTRVVSVPLDEAR